MAKKKTKEIAFENKFFYEVMLDSETGKRLSRYWQNSDRCGQEAEAYVKKMGARFYYEDASCFAGGVLCVAFDDGYRVDEGMWKMVAVDRSDGRVYFAPKCKKRIGEVEIPHRDYALKDTFDRIYDRQHITERDGKLFVKYMEFYGEEPAGTRNDLKGGQQPRQASRALRKAIKAEVMRQRLPTMTIEELFRILGVQLGANDKPTMTPALFPYRSRFFIGCEFECHNDDLQPLTPQTFKTNADKYTRELGNGVN